MLIAKEKAKQGCHARQPCFCDLLLRLRWHAVFWRVMGNGIFDVINSVQVAAITGIAIVHNEKKGLSHSDAYITV